MIRLSARTPSGSLHGQPHGGAARSSSSAPLEPAELPDHIDAMYRAACALCGSRQDAEDLVQETFARVLRRPRFVHRDRGRGYLLRALRNTYYHQYRTAVRRPTTVALADEMVRAPEPTTRAKDVMEAISSAPAPFRDAVIAVDLVGMSYREASRALHTREATITTRLYRGRQHVARILSDTDEPS